MKNTPALSRHSSFALRPAESSTSNTSNDKENNPSEEYYRVLFSEREDILKELKKMRIDFCNIDKAVDETEWTRKREVYSTLEMRLTNIEHMFKMMLPPTHIPFDPNRAFQELTSLIRFFYPNHSFPSPQIEPKEN